jgi:hypothetical protein
LVLPLDITPFVLVCRLIFIAVATLTKANSPSICFCTDFYFKTRSCSSVTQQLLQHCKVSKDLAMGIDQRGKKRQAAQNVAFHF